jgi:hypothetical protein
VRALGHLPMAWCLILLFRPLSLVISFILKLDVINTGYIVYSLFVTLCVKLDPGTHKVMHSVLALKLGVTEDKAIPWQCTWVRRWAVAGRDHGQGDDGSRAATRHVDGMITLAHRRTRSLWPSGPWVGSKQRWAGLVTIFPNIQTLFQHSNFENTKNSLLDVQNFPNFTWW